MARTHGRGWRWLAVVALATVGLHTACARSAPRPAAPAARAQQQQDPTRAQTVDHVAPARDSMGPLPARFVWTAVPGADSYSIGIWNEVDRLLWRMNNIPTTSVARPADVELEPGTYFWSVSALRGGYQIGESGLAAFVVRATP